MTNSKIPLRKLAREKPMILELEDLDDATYDAILAAFETKYKTRLNDLDDQYWFLACSNDGGAMFKQHYTDNPLWDSASLAGGG